jgi:hypothetical protein
MTEFRNESLKGLHIYWEKHFGSHEERETVARLAREKAAADAAMAYQFANLQMPEDIRRRAKEWGMDTFCEVLWNNGFQAGWRERQRGISQEAKE